MLGLSPVPCPPTPALRIITVAEPLLLPFLAHTPTPHDPMTSCTPQHSGAASPIRLESKPIPACFNKIPAESSRTRVSILIEPVWTDFPGGHLWKEFVWTLGQNTRKPLESILKMLALHSPQPWGDPVKVVFQTLQKKQSFSSYRVLEHCQSTLRLFWKRYIDSYREFAGQLKRQERGIR